MENHIMNKDKLLSKLLMEIEQLFSHYIAHGDDEHVKNMFVSSESSQYPPYMIDIRNEPCNWMMEDDKGSRIVVNVLFMKTAKSIKGRYITIDSDELFADNIELQEAMGILIGDVFDDSCGYDITCYPNEIEAKDTLAKLIGDGATNDVKEEDPPFDKDEIKTLVDDLFNSDE